MQVSGNEIRRKYLEFMKSKGHVVIPSAALVPENDPTTLFTGSGMQPLVPYLLGKEHPKGTRLTDSQKCFRAEDIEEVGDNRHTTFFEMLGNWSLGDYFKEEQLEWVFEFLTKELDLDPEKLYITVFSGNETAGIGKDEKSISIWQNLLEKHNLSHQVADMETEEMGGKRGMKEGERIFAYDASKNWWSRSGTPEEMPVGEIGGPDSEIFYDFGGEHNPEFGEYCHPNCDCGRFLEIGNSVFIEFIKQEDGSFANLPSQNVDFGGGLERIAAAVNDNPDVFKVDLLNQVIEKLEKLSGLNYNENIEAFRVITDHIRGAVFMIGDGVTPSNSEQGYFVRRLLRRSVRFGDKINLPEHGLSELSKVVVDLYKDHYQNLEEKQEFIKEEIAKEETQFRKTLEKGLKELNKLAEKGNISGDDAFTLFTTYGFPAELTEEIAKDQEVEVDMEGFEKAMEEHRAKSRAGAEQKFKGGLADSSDKVVQYHTATHLMLAALRKELGDHVHQAGSNITSERTRFDVTHDEKIDRETLDRIEDFVNTALKGGGEVKRETMSKQDAENDPTVEGSFWDRYPDEVHVYTIYNHAGEVLSRELCGGPHVEKLSDIEGEFKIKKEESSSAGVRRIKAVLEN